MRVTFDTNCLIDLELSQGAAAQLQTLVGLHDSGRITVCVPAIGASERLPGGSYASSFSEFQERVWRLSKRESQLLKPLGYWSITYWDHCVWSSEESVELERKIHEALFPRAEFKWQDQAKLHGLDPGEAFKSQHSQYVKWRNRKCDTLAMWCHIHYGCDSFVTRDLRHFHRESKKRALIELGAKRILLPTEAVTFIVHQ